MTQRIDPFFCHYDSQNGIFLWSTNTTHRTEFFFNTTHRIELFFFLKMTFFFDIELFFLNTTQRIEILQYDSEDSTFFSDMTHRINWPFFCLTLRIEPFFLIWLKEFFFWKKKNLKELNVFFNISQRTEFSMTQRIDFFTTQRIEPFFVRLKELNPFSLNLTQRIELFLKSDAKNWTFFVWLKELNPFFSKWLKELNLFFSKCDSKNGTFFSKMWLKELNLFLNMIQRIEFLSYIYDSKSKNRTFFFSIRLNESNTFFLHVTHVFIWFKEIFFRNISQRIDFSCDSKNGTWRRDLKFMFFEIWFTELDFFSDD